MDERQEVLTTLQALQRSHSELASRLVVVLARAMDGGGDDPAWAVVEQLTEKMEAIAAMIDVCPCPILSRPPPTETRH